MTAPRRALKPPRPRFQRLGIAATALIWAVNVAVIVLILLDMQPAPPGFYTPTTPPASPTVKVSHRAGVVPWEGCSAHPSPSCPSAPPTACPTRIPEDQKFWTCRNRK